jgi:hypothetical protein
VYLHRFHVQYPDRSEWFYMCPGPDVRVCSVIFNVHHRLPTTTCVHTSPYIAGVQAFKGVRLYPPKKKLDTGRP